MRGRIRNPEYHKRIIIFNSHLERTNILFYILFFHTEPFSGRKTQCAEPKPPGAVIVLAFWKEPKSKFIVASGSTQKGNNKTWINSFCDHFWVFLQWCGPDPLHERPPGSGSRCQKSLKICQKRAENLNTKLYRTLYIKNYGITGIEKKITGTEKSHKNKHKIYYRYFPISLCTFFQTFFYSLNP